VLHQPGVVVVATVVGSGVVVPSTVVVISPVVVGSIVASTVVVSMTVVVSFSVVVITTLPVCRVRFCQKITSEVSNIVPHTLAIVYRHFMISEQRNHSIHLA